MEADGTRHGFDFSAGDFALRVTDRWTSPRSGATYPSGWQIEVPRFDLTLRVTPIMRDQELPVSVRYWEGAVDVAGTKGGQPIQGRGYVELTGYADAQTD